MMMSFRSLTRTSAKDYAALAARFGLGIVMLVHGLQKVGFIGDGSWIQSATMLSGAIGIGLIAHLVIISELFGSLALIAGFLGRLCAGAVLLIMLGAIVLVHAKNGFFMGNGGYEFHILAIALSVVTMIRGSGAWSVDSVL